MQPKLSKAFSQYGSSMGRSNVHDDASMDKPVVFTVALLKMEDGDYDEGGAYWGAGDERIGYMYRATAEGEDVQIDLFMRALSIGQAKELVRADYPQATFDDETLDDFTEAYITAALFAGTDDDGKPLDDEHDSSDIAPSALESIKADCKRFQAENAQWLTDENLNSRLTVAQQAGHDFLLTRNGFGAGFWDGGWADEAGEALSRASKAFGEADFYLGDDGLIYC